MTPPEKFEMTDAVIEAIGLAHLVEQLPLGAIVERNVLEKVLESSPTRACRHVSLPERRRLARRAPFSAQKVNVGLTPAGIEIRVQCS